MSNVPDVIYDQPNGACDKCIWNKSEDDYMNCGVSMKKLVNTVCIAKIQIAIYQNEVQYREDDQNDD